MYSVETNRMTMILNLRFPTSFSVRFDVIHKWIFLFCFHTDDV